MKEQRMGTQSGISEGWGGGNSHQYSVLACNSIVICQHKKERKGSMVLVLLSTKIDYTQLQAAYGSRVG